MHDLSQLNSDVCSKASFHGHLSVSHLHAQIISVFLSFSSMDSRHRDSLRSYNFEVPKEKRPFLYFSRGCIVVLYLSISLVSMSVMIRVVLAGSMFFKYICTVHFNCRCSYTVLYLISPTSQQTLFSSYP